MFNLIMSGMPWPEARNTFIRARVFEYTEDRLRDEHLAADGSVNFEKLLQYPCLFMGEGTDQEVARVGSLIRARAVGLNVSLEYVFDPEIPPLTNATIFERKADFDMPHDFEFSRVHWALKDVDLFRELLRFVRPRRQRPVVFELAEHERIEGTLASVMMPFGAAFAPVYAAIQGAAQEAGLRCRRADEIWESPAIIQDIVSLIDRSRVVICDCTGRNPNVFYEIGIAHTLGREVILITQNENDIPFDLRHLRYIPYLSNVEGRAALTAALAVRLKAIADV